MLIRLEGACEPAIGARQLVVDLAGGGRFQAPIWVNAKISFEPLRGPAVERLELLKEVRFPPLPNQRWSATPGSAAVQKAGFVSVDTDGDGVTVLPGTTSNFNVGRGTAAKITAQLKTDCHTVDDEGHCV